MTTREQIAELALQLDDDDRAYLADVLERSLLAPGSNYADKAAAEWSAEIDRRIDAYDRGEVQAMTVEESLERIRAALAERRTSQAAG
jgi:putative addiction module component (TIGR02574 family)